MTDLARFTVRAEPWGPLAVGWALAAVIATVAHLDSELELVMVTVAATIGVGSTLTDPAASFTDTTPERRWMRRARTLCPGLIGSFIVWLAVTTGAGMWFDATPTPGRWALLCWTTVVATQIAIASLATRRSRQEQGVGAAAVVASVFVAAFVVPRFHDWLYPVSHHGTMWAAITVSVMAATVWAWRDPATRF